MIIPFLIYPNSFILYLEYLLTFWYTLFALKLIKNPVGFIKYNSLVDGDNYRTARARYLTPDGSSLLHNNSLD